MALAKEVPTRQGVVTHAPSPTPDPLHPARSAFDEAQKHYLQGDYDRAILLLNKLLQKPQQIDSVTIDSNLAEIYRHLGQYNQAIAHWKKAIESIETKNDEVQNPN
ncbi:MAG: tetratricopeptide repeat protein [Hydrococcus sp. SU_1_0]|nr:tetratricopeptide repeat protein [Hydrococcus sp. SU_1_0]